MAASSTSPAPDFIPQQGVVVCQASEGGSAFAGSGGISPEPSAFEEDPSRGNADHHSVISRCVVRSVHDSVARFDERKRNLVKQIGFGGFLYFPPLKSFDRKFSVWLMTKVEEMAPALVIDDERTLRFSKEDVGKVFGIPSCGRRVVDRRSGRKERKVALDKNFPQRSIKAVQEVVDCDYGPFMTKDQEDTFKVSFVVFVMSCVLVPCVKHDYVTAEYWDALVHPEDIKKFDWAAYVLRRLLDAVFKLKSDLERKIRVINLTGCSLFLQVLYLDSIDLGVWNCSHQLLPRVRSFAADRLRYMIDADCKAISSARTAECQYGRSRLRTPSDVCYSWASGLQGMDGSLQVSEQSGLWEDTLLMARQMKLPTGVAGHVYMAIEEHRRQMNEVALRQGRNLVRAVANIVRPFMDGFNYRLDYDSSFWMFGRDGSTDMDGDNIVPEACEQDSCFMCGFDHPGMVEPGYNFGLPMQARHRRPGSTDVPRVGHRIPGSFFGCTHVINLLLEATIGGPCVEVMVMHAMARFYMLSRQCKYSRRIDLNKSLHAEEDYRVPVVTQMSAISVGSFSPWDVGFDSEHGYEAAIRLMAQYTALGKELDVKSAWFVHYAPKYVEVNGADAWSQFIGEAEMEMDMMDVLMRRFKQVDDSLYVRFCGYRWRHFVESDFLALLVAGWPRCFEVCTREQLAGGHLQYLVPKCRVIFFPLLLVHRWVCYAWDLTRNEIVVFDPCALTGKADVIGPWHSHVVSMLKIGMAFAARNLFVGWDHSWDDPAVKMFRTDVDLSAMNKSGMVVAHFCRCFDGNTVTPDFRSVGIREIASLLLSEALQLEGNLGKPPSVLAPEGLVGKVE
ncbi:hypothetical protein EJB05_49155 [Eragrostis curvula]|uniref:Uncharacterized protein n=1 Tax=Eragrostis curvula TaxID=38414 RepID=A0A5J9T3H6_9POAL|nr:hypothetical protein EJB05_49155 [Eragrostis curvula]